MCPLTNRTDGGQEEKGSRLYGLSFAKGRGTIIAPLITPVLEPA